jgi:hypothetical protein
MVRRNCASHQLGHRKDCDDSDKSQCSDVDPYSTSCNLGFLPTYPSNQCSSSSSLSINCFMAEINTVLFRYGSLPSIGVFRQYPRSRRRGARLRFPEMCLHSI